MSVRESFSIKQIKNPSAKAVWGIIKFLFPSLQAQIWKQFNIKFIKLFEIVKLLNSRPGI